MGEGRAATRPGRAAVFTADGPAVRLVAPALLLLVLAGYVAGWIAAWVRNPFQPDGAVATLLYTVGQLLAVLAPLVWGGTVLWLARTDRSRLIGLLLGVVILAPVPLLIGAT